MADQFDPAGDGPPPTEGAPKPKALPPPPPKPTTNFDPAGDGPPPDDVPSGSSNPISDPVPPDPDDPYEAKKMDEVTLDRALILAILDSGLDGFFKSRRYGLEAAHLQSPDDKVYGLFERFARKGRLPTMIEIAADTKQVIVRPPDPFDVDLFAEKIANRALQTSLKEGIGPITRDVLVGDPHQARRDLQTLVRDTAWSLGNVTSYTDPQIAMEIRADYEASKARAGGLQGLSSPWPNVDKHSLGLQAGELTVLLAKRKTGKSWLLFKWAQHVMRNDLKPGETVLIVSMEMTRKSVYRRLAAIDLRLNYQDFRAGRLTTEEEEALFDHCDAMIAGEEEYATIHVACADTIRDVGDICDKVAELRPKAVFLDGLYILGRDKKLGMWERTITNCSELKIDLCANEEIPVAVVATTQLKGSKNKNDLEADADDAAYAKAIGDWADAMRGAFMNPEYEKEKKRVYRAMESREFRGVDLMIHFDLDTMNFNEIKIMGRDGDDDDDGDDSVVGPGAPVLTGRPSGGPSGGGAVEPKVEDEPPDDGPDIMGGHDEEAIDY